MKEKSYRAGLRLCGLFLKEKSYRAELRLCGLFLKEKSYSWTEAVRPIFERRKVTGLG